MMMGMETVIDVNSPITTNTVWTSDNTYHVLVPIDVNEAMLVIEPGTTVTFAAGTSAGIRVLNGGAIISRGTGENPILFTSDASTPAYNDYYCPLYIEETASSATEVTYSIVEWAYIGVILFNQDLNTNIENNYFVNCAYGIIEFGPEHTDIINNLCFGSYYSGIEIYMESYSGEGDSNSEIKIENNTCDFYQDYGITVHGVSDANDAGFVFLGNNIVSDSYWSGLNLIDGYLSAFVFNTGYYDNYTNKNWPFDEYNPIVVTSNPYETASVGYAPICYLNQTCDFIDAGSLMPEQTSFMGQTTSVGSEADTIVTDLGFHYPNWDSNNVDTGSYYSSDYNRDNIVNNEDFVELSLGWLAYYDPNDPNSPNDPNDPNNIIEIYEPNDLMDFAGQWLYTGGPAYNMEPTFSQGPNSLTGYVEMSVVVTDPMISDVWLAIDGKRYGLFTEEDYGTSVVGLDTVELLNGRHSFKVIYLYNGDVVCCEPVDAWVDNEISMQVADDGFTPGETYHFFGIADGNYLVAVDDFINDTEIYSQTFTDEINVHIEPNAFTEEYGIYDMSISGEDPNSGGGAMGPMGMGAPMAPLTWQEIYNIVISREFKKKDLPQDINRKMLISVGDKKLEKIKEKCWKAAVKAAVRKNIWPIFLNSKSCTWENLSHCLHLNKVKMWYHTSHGDSELWFQPPRQCITINNGERVFSHLKKDYPPGSVPPGYEELSFWYEDNHSLLELGFYGTDKMIWVQFNACESARTDDFPNALGIELEPADLGEQVFIGWKNSAKVYDLLGHYNTFEERYWENLRAGNNLDVAVDFALLYVNDTGEISGNFETYGINTMQGVWFRHPTIW